MSSKDRVDPHVAGFYAVMIVCLLAFWIGVVWGIIHALT